ncbi:MAG TPA: hypothetical protein VFE53_06380 [Mucilaginibacter sp.]|jgi:hypothetical protein|nr:hypothetical protein [Mucilaginibacter sp.]
MRTYTHEQLEIELLKNNQNHIFKILDRIEAQQKWILGLIGTGFLGVLGLMAHGFKWIL